MNVAVHKCPRRPPCRMPKGSNIDRGTAGSGSTSRRTAATTIELAHREGFHDETMRHLATRLRRASARRCVSIKESAAGSSSRVTWAWRSTGQQAGLLRAGSARHPSIAFASRCASSTPTWTRSRASKVYLTDLALYAEFDVFPHNPPTSSAVQVAGLLLEARIEMDAVAFIAKG